MTAGSKRRLTPCEYEFKLEVDETVLQKNVYKKGDITKWHN